MNRIDGFDVCQAPLEVQRRIGVLADARGLYPRLTSLENIRYYGRLHSLNGEALEKQIDSLLLMLDMQAIADRRTEGFSTGEKLKVAIARTLVHNPKNVLLDEPTNGLDVMSTRAMRQFIIRLREEAETTLALAHTMAVGLVNAGGAAKTEDDGLCAETPVADLGALLASGRMASNSMAQTLGVVMGSSPASSSSGQVMQMMVV
jgi:ABC-type multidrug transport system ATPase subunit